MGRKVLQTQCKEKHPPSLIGSHSGLHGTMHARVAFCGVLAPWAHVLASCGSRDICSFYFFVLHQATRGKRLVLKLKAEGVNDLASLSKLRAGFEDNEVHDCRFSSFSLWSRLHTSSHQCLLAHAAFPCSASLLVSRTSPDLTMAHRHHLSSYCKTIFRASSGL